MASKINISTCLWFESRAEDAANFYVTLFDDANITSVVRASGDSVMTVTLTLNGHEIMLLNGGPHNAVGGHRGSQFGPESDPGVPVWRVTSTPLDSAKRGEDHEDR